MLLKTGLIMLLISTVSAAERQPNTSAMKRATFLNHSPLEVARCLSSVPPVGCDTFLCLENSTCDTVGLYDICNNFFNGAAVFNREGRTFFKESIKCIANGITSKISQTMLHCSTFQKMITEIQEECYEKLNICEVAGSNPDAIGEVIQIPKQFPNRYYSTMLQSFLECDDETVEIVRSGLMSKLGPDMLTLFQLLQKKPCTQDHGTGKGDEHESFLWPLGPPMFKIQSDFNREPNHLFAKKRSVQKNSM